MTLKRTLVEIVLALSTEHALLYGPRGVAKTTTAVESAVDDQTVYQTTFTAEAGSAQYLGHYVPQGMEFKWHKGPFQLAWETGGLLVINEVDHASEDTSNLLHALLDDGLGAYFTLPTGDTITPKKGFRCIATMNGVPSDLAPAVLDRFRLRIPILQPSQAQLDSLPPDVAATCKNFYERGDSEQTTFRMLASFVKLRDQFAAKYPRDEAELMAATVIYGDEALGRALIKTIRLNDPKAAVTPGTGGSR